MKLSPRYFNTTGPCRPEDHYMLSPGRRLPELRRLIQEKRYFVLHAPRQTGKTTTMRALAAELRAEGGVALHVSLETSRQEPSVAVAEPRWMRSIAWNAELELPPEDRPPDPDTISGAVGDLLRVMLSRWCVKVRPRPVVLLLDEVDTIEGEAMVSFLAQLRGGFHLRPGGFPASIAFIGMRDLRDYLIQAKDGMPPNPGSPFNIKSHSLTLSNFTRDEVAELYAQHTADTGQPFTDGAVDRSFYWSCGQPFLVNALAYHLTREEPIPAPQPITAADIDRAKVALIKSRTTHLHNLEHRLYEPRVARVVRPVLLGEPLPSDCPDDLDYAVDLGLLRRGHAGYEAANPIYREVLVRALTYIHQNSLADPWWPWQRPDGGLDFPALMDAFLVWWRRHGDILKDQVNAGWREAAGHLIFMGFLQRVVNGGGRVEREYASGRGRLDLLVEYGPQRVAVELKRVPPAKVSFETVREEGIGQLCNYLDEIGLTEGWLLIFDQREGRSWEDRLWREDLEVGGRTLHLCGA
ncbi:MAG: ATP-binding protein [Alphaproteobacteria bacterium]|nr:ATP-binding protein [Alphaproteobacteria bacterium]